ncbi:MAG: hypothetical protein ABIQ52_14290 [Vicinamibacterales bacterium]
MRVFAHGVAAACLIASVPFSGTTSGQAADPATVLAAARQALGGEKKLSAVKSFTATGRTRQVRGDNLVPIEFEIFVELPDKYVRKDEIPAQESGPTTSGFSGDELVQAPPPPPPPPMPAMPPGAPAGPPRNPGAARVLTLKQDFARLTLGMFAASFSSYPMTFTYVGEAEAPQGKADVIDAKGANNFTIRLFINKETHLPIMVSWTPPAPAGRGMPPGRGPTPGGAPGAGAAAVPGGERGGPPAPGPPASAPAAAGATPPAAPAPTGQRGAPPAAAPGGPAPGARPTPPVPIEQRLYFADYRDVDGMQFPFRLRRAAGADTTEETTFDRFKVNPKIDPKKFEVRKQ